MKTTRKLAGLAMLCLAVLFLHACDYYEPPQLLLEEENISESSDVSNEITELKTEDKITLYKVDGDILMKIQDYEVEGELLEFQKDVAKHHEIWELTKKIIPPEYRSMLSEFLIYHGDASNTSGFVDPTINDLSKWQFAIAIDYAYRNGFNSDGEVAFTIIHEFGHLLTLNNEQITPGVIPKNCPNYYVSKGCAKTDSYVSVFHNKFWLAIEEEFNGLEKTTEAKSSFFTKYNTSFVSEYAATGPREDIAEVFATFVIQSDRPDGTAIAEQKIQMMYEYEELIVVRDYIRRNIIGAKGLGFLPSGKRNREVNCLTGL